MFIQTRHNSDAILTVIHLIDGLKTSKEEQATNKLTVLLSILEPMLRNNQNLEMIIENNGIKCLMELVEVEGAEKYAAYLKNVMRCIASCARSEIAVTKVKFPIIFQLLQSNYHLKKIEQILQNVSDEEIAANTLKITRKCFREDYVWLL